jgi:gamma-D-glutamyl-L-lysine dipeptidyl-peptidase
MHFGISLQSLVPVRSEASHRSEMVTQLLFGELYRVYDNNQGWQKIKTSQDNYEGWIDSRQSTPLDEQEFLRLFYADTPCSLDLVQLVYNETQKLLFPILMGSSLPGLEGQFFTINGENYVFEGPVSDSTQLEEAGSLQERLEAKKGIAEDAMLYLNSPYQWGGRSPFGIDCSGFAQMVYKLKKIKLLRDASQQSTQGDVVNLLEEAEPGDLAFFDNEEGNITHVGILLDRFRVIHASGRVRIDSIDHEGIFDEKLGKYTHRLRLMKRIV